MFKPKPLLFFTFLFVVLFPYTKLIAQTNSEILDAAVRLKMAHVERSYRRCIDAGGNDATCRAELDALHPRELAALGRFAVLSSTVSGETLTKTMTECYDPHRDYEELIACWEESASKLEEAISQNGASPLGSEPNQISPSDLQVHIINQLKCLETPNPVFAFLALERMGKIRTANRIGYDGISCFKIEGGFEVEGMILTSVCGYVRGSLEKQLFPDLLWRGPGTSPEQFIAFGAQTSMENAANWYRSAVSSRGPNRGTIRVGNRVLGEEVQIRCGF